jgi:hypothetical protein
VDRLLTGGGWKDVQRRYREGVGDLRIPAGGANPGTVGTAVDLAVRFYVEAYPDFGMAVGAATQLGEIAVDLAEELVRRVDGTATRRGHLRPAGMPVTEPLRVPERDIDAVARASWVLALLVEIFRAGPRPDNSIVQYFETVTQPTVDGMLAIAHDYEVAEVRAVVELARGELLPRLAGEPTPWHVNPIFTGSRWMPADADLITGRTLVEVKVKLGGKRMKDGSRYANLDLETVRQLVGYVLHDVDDVYRLDRVAIYEGRYGLLTSWPLQDFLDRLAGWNVDLAAEREAYQHLLTTGESIEPDYVEDREDNTLYYIDSPRELPEF